MQLSSQACSTPLPPDVSHPGLKIQLVHRSLIKDSIPDWFQDAIVRSGCRARRDAYYQVYLRHKLNVIAGLGERRFNRELARLAVNWYVHKAIERRRDVVFGNPMPLQSESKIPEAPMMRLLIRIAEAEGILGARCHEEVVPAYCVLHN